jgi:hypothetical protein
MPRRKDPSLDLLRDAAGHLVFSGERFGAFVTWVAPFWGLGRPFSIQERVFMSIEWADGRQDEEIEDYPPWAAFVDEVRAGTLEWTDSPHEGHYEVEWVDGDEKRAMLERLHPAHQDRA